MTHTASAARRRRRPMPLPQRIARIAVRVLLIALACVAGAIVGKGVLALDSFLDLQRHQAVIAGPTVEVTVQPGEGISHICERVNPGADVGRCVKDVILLNPESVSEDQLRIQAWDVIRVPLSMR